MLYEGIASDIFCESMSPSNMKGNGSEPNNRDNGHNLESIVTKKDIEASSPIGIILNRT